jgi:hypothetical protein
MMLAHPKTLLRLEGAVVAAAAIILYARADASWVRFVLLLLVPDLAIIGYLAGAAAGAATYNLVHTYALPVILAGAGFVANSPLVVSLALIWATHIGADRALGFGLKYPTAFRETHLQHV